MPIENVIPDKSLLKDISDPNQLSKKERRKLKVQEKTQTNSSNTGPAATKPSDSFKKSEKKKKDLKQPRNNEVLPKFETKTGNEGKQMIQPGTGVLQDTKNMDAKNKNEKAVTATMPPQNDAQEETKSKAQLRVERRELQEKQRLQKQAVKENLKDVQRDIKKNDVTPITNQAIKPKSPRKAVDNQDSTKRHGHRVQLFRHLEKSIGYKPSTIYKNVHPAIIQLGAQYAEKTIIGSNARCLALLNALKYLIADFQTPFNQELCRAFETHLHNNVEHIQKCRPFAVSMTNALRHFKLHLTQIPTSITDSDKKEQMHNLVDSYVKDEIEKAAEAISINVCKKITDNDVILTYGHSSLVNNILIDAKNSGKTFKVIVVDARPLLEGRYTLNKLVKAGIECTYILITATNFIINRATKVIMGAHALLNNGYVMARAGTALVALIAKIHMKPVLVCCETSKFSERAQTDSFVYNEIGEPDDVMAIKNKNGYLSALNLMYDVTPPKYVTGVATELGILPCTSVPVILRLKPTE